MSLFPALSFFCSQAFLYARPLSAANASRWAFVTIATNEIDQKENTMNSPSNKINIQGLSLALLSGLGIAVAGTVATLFIHILVFGIGRNTTIEFSSTGLTQIIFLNVLYFLPGFVVGYLLGKTVGEISLRRGNTSLTAVLAIVVVSVIASFAGYILGYPYVAKNEAFDSIADYTRLAFLLVFMGSFAWVSAKSVILTPFCEKDRKKIEDKISLGMYPLEYEKSLTRNLNAYDFASISVLVPHAIKDDSNCISISLFYCAACKERGFIRVEVTQTLRRFNAKGESYASKSNRSIFSSDLNKDEIATCLAIAEKVRGN